MSKLSREDILKLARLSRIELTEEEIDQFGEELGDILEYAQALQQVDLDGLEPTYQVTGLTDVMRPDEEINYGPDAAELLKNAPNKEDGHFKVPRMVG